MPSGESVSNQPAEYVVELKLWQSAVESSLAELAGEEPINGVRRVVWRAPLDGQAGILEQSVLTEGGEIAPLTLYVEDTDTRQGKSMFDASTGLFRGLDLINPRPYGKFVFNALGFTEPPEGRLLQDLVIFGDHTKHPLTLYEKKAASICQNLPHTRATPANQ